MVLIGVWIHPSSLNTRERVMEVADIVARVPMTKLVVLVKDGNGKLFFKYGRHKPEYDYLRDLIEVAKDRSLEVHAWFVVLREGGEVPRGWLAENTRYAVVDERGRPVGWICPSHEEARKRVLDLFRSLLDEYEVDGIHLDYIRYPEPVMAKGCFCDQCGKEGYLNEEWVMRGVSHVDTLVEETYELVKEYGVELSAAVFPNYPECIIGVRQDWGKWVDQGLLDWVAPMNYTNIMSVFNVRSMIHVYVIPEGILLLEGIGKKSSVSSLSPGKMIRQAEAAVKAGADGVVVFSYGSLTEKDLKLLRIFRARCRFSS